MQTRQLLVGAAILMVSVCAMAADDDCTQNLDPAQGTILTDLVQAAKCIETQTKDTGVLLVGPRQQPPQVADAIWTETFDAKQDGLLVVHLFAKRLRKGSVGFPTMTVSATLQTSVEIDGRECISDSQENKGVLLTQVQTSVVCHRQIAAGTRVLRVKRVDSEPATSSAYALRVNYFLLRAPVE